MPVFAGLVFRESAPPPLTVTTKVPPVTGEPAQVESLGGKSLNVIVPPGEKPPLSVAVSQIKVPMLTDPLLTVVLIPGEALLTTLASLASPHAPVAAGKTPSPL